jgi:PAS domain S-box-containing protein
MKDDAGRYVYMNEAMRWLFEVDPDAPGGATDLDFMPRELATRVRAHDDAVRESGRDVHMVENVPLPDGSLRHWMTHKFPFVDAAGTRFVGGVAVDVTERKEVERELERLLAREREQNAELRTLDRMKDEFVALVSHELRTPLTSIRGYVELLAEGEAGDLSPDQQHFLAVVARNADRLHSLVGDLLFMAQLEAGRITLERGPVDLGEVAAEAVETGRPLADGKGIALSLAAEPDVALEADRGRIGQVLDNFVSNAVKFTSPGGAVDVRVATEAGRAVVEVRDTGMGIPADEQAQLFERFFRSSTARKSAIQGTGLGLTISKAIVEAHGGEIAFTSVEGAGTTFRIELPLAAAVTVTHVTEEAA